MPEHAWKHYNYDLPNHSIIWPDPWNPMAGSLYQMSCRHNMIEADEHLNRGDLRDKISKCSIVIHAAAVADLNESEKDAIKNRRINVEGTENVAKTCAEFEKPLIFISTCCAYGTTSPLKILGENSTPRPTESYAKSKLEAENLLMDMAGKTWKFWRRNGLKVRICRMGTMYGPGMREALFNSIALRHCAEGKMIEVHGSGQQSRQYLYIDDAVSGIETIMSKGMDGEIYNITGIFPISVTMTLAEAQGLTGKTLVVKCVDDRMGQIHDQNISISKAMSLGWHIYVSYRAGMKKSWEWLKAKHGYE